MVDKAKRSTKSLSEMDADKVYTVQELLDFFPVSKSKLYAALKKAKVPTLPGLGKRALYLGRDVLKYFCETTA